MYTASRSAARQTAFDEFVLAQGKGLVDFATWCAIMEHLDGRDWPAELADTAAPGVVERGMFGVALRRNRPMPLPD